ncbi:MULTISPECIES: Na+/H+ antiporter family protein [Oceanobacillus]|uniref:Na+/H+ antiporter family protein n=1 Tax=Oceanobacillus aidingensis TaxID=645964 RepID=A0ABV9K0U1_9BACI|nr:Na+/H+ antiporter NhaC family protein [Oceanobacillus oncorhynchi]MDM8102361.1 Na+/H+ antiporter NhaC family protein [Oceanobacillus oncorhynchi]UUI39333.1 TRAP transporter large permease subunit [Oceanobacillus oncorhynchi]
MLTNAVLVSVLVMVVVSLFRVNVLFAIILAALTAGLMSGMSLGEAAELMVSGMGGQSNTALSYVLLGIFAVMIGLSGITTILVNKMLTLFRGKKMALVLSLAVIACLSQNIVPVHIAFIPILIPPLLGLFNKLKLDRRAVAAALTFGLKAPYMTIPVGFGLIFQGIIRDEMIANNMPITLNEVTISMLIPGAGMVVGLLVAIFITYRKDHLPKESQPDEANIEVAYTEEKGNWGFYQWMTIIAIIAALVTQLMTESLILGALAGIIILFATRVIKMNENEKVVQKGIGMMGMIAFIMLVASGYATVLQETGGIEQLVEQAISMVGTSSFLIATTMLVVGLFITMGIGTSFGTIPILAALYVPICAAAGLSPLATAALIGTAGALGDAGSPASDSTLGPTAGLNADGRHNHIWDTCVPTFLHYNIPLFICGVIAAVIL